MAGSRVDRLCLLGGAGQRRDYRRARSDSEDPDDGHEKTGGGHCAGCRGTDRTLGRMRWMGGSQSGFGGSQEDTCPTAWMDRQPGDRHGGTYD